MSRLARIFQIKHFLVYNALCWIVLGGVALAQYRAYATAWQQTFDWHTVIRHPGATYLACWILSFLVFDLYLATRRWQRVWFWTAHTTGAVAFGFLHKTLSYVVGLLLERLFLGQETRTARALVELWQQTLPDVLYGTGLYGLILLVLSALDYRRRWHEERALASTLAQQLAQSQLQAMKLQLQPHFLFNALNTIAMMVRRGKATEAVGMLASLSEMLRSHLRREQQQWVVLKEELRLLDQYLAIEQARYPDRLRVVRRILPDTQLLRVPNLILQPIVENAFKHGISQHLSRARLEISARREGKHLVLEVFNTGRALPDGWNLHNHRGVGLGNTVDRLTRLYQGNFRFQIREEEDGVRVRMVLPTGEEAVVS